MPSAIADGYRPIHETSPGGTTEGQPQAMSVVPPGLSNQETEEPVTVVTGRSLSSLPGLNRTVPNVRSADRSRSSLVGRGEISTTFHQHASNDSIRQPPFSFAVESAGR